MPRALRTLLHLCLLLALFWLLGFLWFLGQLPTRTETSSFRYTDAIVVLTGGSGRIEHGLQRLGEGTAKWLFITGVFPTSKQDAVFSAELRETAAYQRYKPFIVLGRKATNTTGNAQETAEWMEENGHRSMRLVTASYHMPRSLLEFAIAMPDKQIVADPVFTGNFREQWWTSPGSAWLLLTEYHKYLITALLYLFEEF